MRKFLQAFLPLGLLLVTVSAAQKPAITTTAEDDQGSSSVISEARFVKLTTRREGEVTHFYVENSEYCEITMTFDMSLTHLKGSVAFPYTATFAPRQKTEAFVLTPDAPEAKWEYAYTNYFKLGSCLAQHDDSYVYQLPYDPGARFPVTQGYNGAYSHKGSNQYAIDWKMPEGTIVRAARGGVVVKVKDDSTRGGGSMKFDKFNNYVLIRHDDGTLGHYCHLRHNGALVHVGETVVTGQAIAHSGNTGFSSGPHLHFCVFKTKNGKERESLPVKFRTATEEAVTLVEDKTYRAAALSSEGTKLVSTAHQLVPRGGSVQ